MIRKNESERAIHDEIVQCVDKLLKLYKDQYKERLLNSMVQRECYIERCEERLNKLVYELYDLKPDEIAIIEKALEKKYPAAKV